MTLQIKELIKEVKQLNATEFEAFYRQLETLRSQKVSGLAAEKEQQLLEKINTPFTKKKNIRFNLLIAKRDTKTLTEGEYQELLELTESFENYELRRLKLITKLADLKKISLPEVINFYQLHPSENN
ncbi:MAG: hypothetical protein AAF960_25460 [Bacteroidota bacterium]